MRSSTGRLHASTSVLRRMARLSPVSPAVLCLTPCCALSRGPLAGSERPALHPYPTGRAPQSQLRVHPERHRLRLELPPPRQAHHASHRPLPDQHLRHEGLYRRNLLSPPPVTSSGVIRSCGSEATRELAQKLTRSWKSPLGLYDVCV